VQKTVERRPLWSERRGGSLALSKLGFATLLVDAFQSLREGGYVRLSSGLPGPPQTTPLQLEPAGRKYAFYFARSGPVRCPPRCFCFLSDARVSCEPRRALSAAGARGTKGEMMWRLPGPRLTGDDVGSL
jgi:hypothetical protein